MAQLLSLSLINVLNIIRHGSSDRVRLHQCRGVAVVLSLQVSVRIYETSP